MSKKTFIYSIFLLIFIAIFIQSVYNLTIIINNKTQNKDHLVYTNKSTIDYEVYIKENEFIKGPIMPKGKTYITKLIDKIAFKYSYTFSAKEVLDLKSDHLVKVTLIGKYNENPTSTSNPVIWEKEYVIKDVKQTIQEDGSAIIINEEFDIVLATFNEEASKFLVNFEIPTTASLIVSMPVKLTGTSDTYKLNEPYEVVAEIPLLEKVTYVAAELERDEERSQASFIATTAKINERRAAVYSVMLVGSLLMIFATFRRLPLFYSEEEYKDYIESLKKEYDDIIVETNNMIDIKELKPIIITSFKEMVNLAQSLETPIILFEKPNFASFYIVKNNIIYLFLVKDDNKELKDLFKK